jgi:hypothetical protein
MPRRRGHDSDNKQPYAGPLSGSQREMQLDDATAQSRGPRRKPDRQHKRRTSSVAKRTPHGDHTDRRRSS